MAIFITHLADVGLISIDNISFITSTLMERVHNFIKEQDKICEVEEITENIYVLLTQKEEVLLNISKTIYDQILSVSLMNAKEFPSISSRVIFKYMDLIEKIEAI
jgi:hypothetical protein